MRRRGEIVEAAPAAADALARGRRRKLQLGEPLLPHVHRDDRPRVGNLPLGQPAQREAALQRGRGVGRRTEDPGRVARRGRPRRRRVRLQAAEARRAPGDEDRGDAAGADARAVDPRHAPLDRRVVDEIPSLEVVEAVHDQVHVGDELADVPRVDVGDDRLDHDVAVDPRDPPRRGRGLRQLVLDVVLVEERLALQVGELDDVAVHDPQEADAGAGEEVRRDGAEPAAAEEQHARAPHPLLSRRPEGGEEDLPRIAPAERPDVGHSTLSSPRRGVLPAANRNVTLFHWKRPFPGRFPIPHTPPRSSRSCPRSTTRSGPTTPRTCPA